MMTDAEMIERNDIESELLEARLEREARTKSAHFEIGGVGQVDRPAGVPDEQPDAVSRGEKVIELAAGVEADGVAGFGDARRGHRPRTGVDAGGDEFLRHVDERRAGGQ